MANHHFNFRQFTIQQEHCGMKVCTDACIFGAFVAARTLSNLSAAANILDIGTGTGLLTLMLAQQKQPSQNIDAIELDEAAYLQAKKNFLQSGWAESLHIFNTNATLFNPARKYEFIISNPPFFEGDLKSSNNKKNMAKHDTGLTLEQLLKVIHNNLSPGGSFAVLLPYGREGDFIKICAGSGYFPNEQLLIQHTKAHPFFRAILLFSRRRDILINHTLIIKNSEGIYTSEFTALLKDYYLHL